jgi:tetratricopeptide (TPR) repeat protein
MLRWLNRLVSRLWRLSFLHGPLQRMTWCYGRDRKPGMTDTDKLFLIMRSFCAGLRPLGRVDPRYVAAKGIMARLAVREIATDYDRSGILPPGTFNLLADPIAKVDLAEAERLLLEAVAEAPDFAEAHLALAFLLRDRGDRDGALVQYLLAAAGRAQIPGNSVGTAVNAEAFHEAGVLLAEAGLLQQAEHCQRRAIDADGASPRVQLAYARTLASRGRFAEAAHQMGLSVLGRTS